MEKIANPFVEHHVNTASAPQPTIPSWIHESYSQCYEDVIICGELNAYQLRNNTTLNSNNLTYVEIGANHPFSTSSTFLISKRFNTSGILVEPNPELANALRNYRPNDKVIEAAVVDNDEEEISFFLCEENEISSVDENFVAVWSGATKSYPGVQEKITVKTTRVNDLLSEVSDKEVVILFIDVEGLDLRILKDIDFSTYKPYIIVIEPSEAYAPGTTDSMIDYMNENGYRLFSSNFVNLLFTRG